MRHPNRFLTALVTAALVIVQCPLGGRALQAAAPESIGGLGDRFLNGNGVGNQSSGHEPVPLSATQISGFFSARDTTQIPGFFGVNDTLRLGTTQEPWDLNPLTEAGLQMEPLPLLTESPQVLAQADDQLVEAVRLVNQGVELLNQSRFRDSILFFEEALEILQELGYPQVQGVILHNLGIAYRSLGEYERAIDLYEQHLVIAREIGDRGWEGTTLGNLGKAYNDLGQYERAIDFHQQSLAVARESKDRIGEAHALVNLGATYNNLGQYERAIDFHQQAMAIYRELGDRTGESAALGSLGNAYNDLGRYDRAVDFYEQALAIFRDLENRAGEGAVLGGLGNAYDSLGQYERAIDLHERSLAITREIGDRRGEGITINNLGVVYRNLSQYERAIDLHRQALEIAREIGDRFGEGAALGNLGIAYLNLGQYERAIDFHQQALEIAQEIGDRRGEGSASGGLGNAYFRLGQYERAIDFHEQRLAIAREISDRDGEGTALGNLGLAYLNLGQYQQAIEHFEPALVIFREFSGTAKEGIILVNLGSAYLSLGQYQQAINFYGQSLALFRRISDRAGEGSALGNLGAAYIRLGQNDQALEQFRQAVALFHELGAPAEEALFLSNIGKLLNRQDQPELAIIFLKASVEVREAIRGDISGLSTDLQQSFTDTVAADYRLLADLLLQQDRILEAQRVLDLLKVQELDEALSSVQRNSATESGVAFWQIESDLLVLYEQTLAETGELQDLSDRSYDDLSAAERQRLTELNDRYRDIQQRFTAFLDRPEVNTLLTQIRQDPDNQSLDIEQQYLALRNNLRAQPQNTALLYPLILPDRLELVLITADGPPLRYPIDVTGADLNRAIVDFGQALKDRTSNIEPLAQELYSWLIAPLEPQLTQAGIESIIYAPDGALRYIPLAALHDGDQYLAERFNLSHITAVSLSNLSLVTEPEQRRVLAAACGECNYTITVGDRDFPFGDLPYAAMEVTRLAEQVPNTSVLLNQGFSKTELENRLRSYTVIHLATHGAVVAEAPRQSFLVMGDGSTLSLETIRTDWDLSRAELVVLSACETAVGSRELGSGVEILGLGYQIQEAGAQAVIASLWNVSDPGTEALMTAFYTALEQEGMTKAEALRAAQVALIRNQAAEIGGERAGAPPVAREGTVTATAPGYSHPYYWAPFILIGNGL